MRYIDKTGCKSGFERGNDQEIKTLGKLTREATLAAENRGLGLLKTRRGIYRVIRASGLGAYDNDFMTLAEVNDFLVNL